MIYFEIFLLIVGFSLIVGGLMGCIVPAVPGPPLSYVALLILHYTRFGNFSIIFLIITAVITIIVTVLDYILPIWGTKKFGGSWLGTLGSVVGLIIGLFFMPWGIIIGPFVGAVLGELIKSRDAVLALRAGIGSFIGFIFGVAMKFSVCIVLTYFFIKEFIVGLIRVIGS